MNGLFAIALSCVFSAATGVPIFLAHSREPELSACVASFIRVAVSCIPVFGSAFFIPGGLRALRGDGRWELWIWGALGAATVLMYFFSLSYVGMGEAAFLYAANGMVIIFFQPLFMKTRLSMGSALAAGGGLLGLCVMNSAQASHETLIAHLWLGRSLGVLSAFTAAVALLMVSRIGTRQSTRTVMAYWCFVCLIVHLAWIAVARPQWPVAPSTWALLFTGGVLATCQQYFLAIGFQRAPAAPAAALGYLAPVLSLVFDIFFFGAQWQARSLGGAALILAFGVALPFLALKPSGPYQLIRKRFLRTASMLRK